MMMYHPQASVPGRPEYLRHESINGGDIESTANLIADLLDLVVAPSLGFCTILLTNGQARRLAVLAKEGTP